MGRLFIVVLVVGSLWVDASRAIPRRAAPEEAAGPVAVAAMTMCDLLDETQRAKAVIPFDDRARKTWAFVPGERGGLPLAEMNDAQRRAVHAVLQNVLSTAGYLKTTGVMTLEGILREIENAAHRNPLMYYVSVFGSPGVGNWGFKFEGHHVSLNFTGLGPATVTATPAFFGTNPAEVRSGESAGWRLLAAEEDLGFQLLDSLDDTQRKQAIIQDKAPADILLAPGKSRELDTAGVSVRDLNQHQRALLQRLIEEYVHNFRAELAAPRLTQISAEFDDVRFAWAGAQDRSAGHYYRVHGLSFAIEFDNVQGGANHVHTVFSDLDDEFGDATLREHYKRHHSDDGSE